MLARLLEKTDRDAFTHSVLSLTTVGPVGDAIRALGVPVAAVRLTRLPRPAALAALIHETALAGRVHLLGPRADVPRIYAALDVYCPSSYTEAFPLVVGEAMASGVPCAVTDAGDSALMVGETGRVVPPRDLLALAAALDACWHSASTSAPGWAARPARASPGTTRSAR